MMTMNDQETIPSRSSLDTDRIEEPHHDDDLDTSSSTSDSTPIITNPLQQAAHLLCESILDCDFTLYSHELTLDSREAKSTHPNHEFRSLVSRMSLIEHQPHHEQQDQY